MNKDEFTNLYQFIYMKFILIEIFVVIKLLNIFYHFTMNFFILGLLKKSFYKSKLNKY